MLPLTLRLDGAAGTMDENSRFRGTIDDRDDTFPVETGGRGVLMIKERNRYEYYDDDLIATPLFVSDTIRQLPFPPSVAARKRWHENIYEPWRTAPNHDHFLSKYKLSATIHEKLQLELEAAFWKVMTLEGYDVSEEMMAELHQRFAEQKDRQERFKHHLRSSWQRPCASGSFACCDTRPSFMFTSKYN